MNPHKKLSSRQKSEESEQLTAQSQTESQSQHEFQTVEELLRHDAHQTPVPQTIARRLQESIELNPPPPRPWWRRLLGG